MADKVRVRYAPSPTGHLHIGNARTALFNYLYARHEGGDFIIRIEDTDKKRNIEDGESSQLDNLTWLGIDWDEGPDKPGEYGPYRQSERDEIYHKYLNQLLEQGDAYYAFDTAEELEAEREAQRANGEMPHYTGTWRDRSQEEIDQARAEGRPETIRFRIPEGQTYRFDDMVKGEVKFESKDISGDFVILKNDGSPTYNFAVVVDDHLMAITHVLRGDDHVANTPKQLMIYDALGWQAPKYGHMSLITNAETGKKLSKRDESILQFIEQYRDLGYLPEAMFNFITLLGWSPVGEDEIFSKEEFIEMFDPDRLSKSPAAFDNKKLEWINNRYMKEKDAEAIADLAIPHLQKAGRISDNPSQEEMEWTKKLISLYQDEMSYAAEIVPLSDMFFHEDLEIADDAKEVLETETAPVVVQAFRDKVDDIEPFTEENIMAAIKAVQKETGIKGKNLYMPLRVATSGEQHGPSIGLTIEVLGKDKVKHHLDQVLAKF
ncbi:glutamate--tRNA ligase [Aerococcus sanguinicola]|uniref:Glutamate--tRNA ligase n=2 Tax=Lactobacillales TaxID=186826 RepID=A0A109RES5_9LACT|nr:MULTISPECIES: glutamate--tRNA ligase [Aerococcus]AMB93926.1 glutamate--tRNA ligase [Aerococcus sanguinicola]MDK7050556.1 glutamate--tRNA ligase [Aerococcus sanguinicola]OFT97201.1 glutamate--tRNA ligase [Aerococcus sp. HMSC23C02]PKZ21123.1 glutamate--tRNA ligase [Aerococcus sanguinicola]